MEAKLFINNYGKIECECDAAGLYGECRHMQPEKVIAWLVGRVQSAEALVAQKVMIQSQLAMRERVIDVLQNQLAQKQEEIDALSSILHNSEV